MTQGDGDYPKTHSYMKRIAIIDIDDVLPYVVYNSRDDRRYRDYCGHKVNLSNTKFILFRHYYDRHKRIYCKHCGIEGEYFALESARNGEAEAHLNLYGRDADGEEVLLTRDHILPRSKGGKDTLYNTQVLCLPCNKAKGDTVRNKMFIDQMPTISRSRILGALMYGARQAGVYHHEQAPLYINLRTIEPLIEYLETLGLKAEE